MKTPIFASLVLAASLAVFAHPTHAGKVDDPELYTMEKLKQNLILGKTTKEQVRAIYGEPDSVSRASAKEGNYETGWTYWPSESHGEKARSRVSSFLKGMIPGRAGTAADVAEEHGAGARNVKGYSLRISFSREGIVEDYRQSEDNASRRL